MRGQQRCKAALVQDCLIDGSASRLLRAFVPSRFSLSLGLLLFLIPACKSAEPKPTETQARQSRALADPFSYGSSMQELRTQQEGDADEPEPFTRDVTGFDKKGFKSDIDRFFNP